MDLFKLTGKVAIVTGSSRGIGRSIAIQLAQAGARVVVSSRKLPACEDVVKTIRDAGGDAMAIAANISDKAQLEALVAQTRAAWGGIDIMVCNAATNPYYGPMTGLSDEVFDKIMRNNVLSNAWLCNLAYPDMKAKKDGAIVIVSSIGGIRGTDVLGIYGISKAADFALARNIAVEWGPKNVRANCIAPGLVKTDFARALWENPEYLEKRTRTSPLRRIGEPDEIGGIVAFLASKAATFMTGQIVVADGGVTIAS